MQLAISSVTTTLNPIRDCGFRRPHKLHSVYGNRESGLIKITVIQLNFTNT